MPAAGAGKPYQHASAVAPNEAAASALWRAQTEQLAAAAAERRRAAEPKPAAVGDDGTAERPKPAEGADRAQADERRHPNCVCVIIVFRQCK